MPSTVISAFDYDPGKHRLDVVFVSGRRYRYSDVPEIIYRRMRRATSKGVFFNRNVRGRFPYERVG